MIIYMMVYLYYIHNIIYYITNLNNHHIISGVIELHGSHGSPFREAQHLAIQVPR
jgi:hypothetical protein